MIEAEDRELWQARGKIEGRALDPREGTIVERQVRRFVREGESLEWANRVVLAKAAGGIGLGGLLSGVAVALGRAGSVSGGPESIAGSIPKQPRVALGVFTERIGLYSTVWSSELWSAPRSVVVRVERRPRLQLLARMRLHFSDGSWAAFLVPRRKTIDALAALLQTPADSQ
jgi:hypothetical protein